MDDRDPACWEALEELFERALDLPDERRSAYLDSACGDDEELRAELESLLASAEQAEDLFDRLARELPYASGETEGGEGRPPRQADPLIGRQIGGYRIRERIGAGGMGVVYEALDARLDRSVALKFLPPHLVADRRAAERFLVEARAAAALDHPNICTVYEIGETDAGHLFISMACYEGETLKEKIARGPLPIEEVIDYAAQIARGLEKAHEQGIVHRDIKPANLLITGDGVLKILDFGLAKMRDVTVTRSGATLGTVAYMAPEQLRGDEVDARADLWSLGVVLYEMLSGKRPFIGDGEQAVIYSILNEEPAPLSGRCPDIPPALQAVAAKLLQRDPADRYPSATEFLAAADARVLASAGVVAARSGGRFARVRAGFAGLLILGIGGYALWRGLAPSLSETIPPEATAAERKMIVVLPFENLGPPEDVYFAAGMTDEITSRLSAVSGLGVISRKSALRYAGTDKSTGEIGAELGVGYILGGSVRWAAGGSGRVRITPELVRVADDTQVWSKPYDRAIEDIFEVQSDISSQVIERLGVTLLEPERSALEVMPTENPDAYTLYLKGRYFWYKRTAENVQKGLSYFQQAVELDPGYALAHVGIADTWIFRGWYSVLAPQETFPKAKQAALQALEYDETLAEAHTSLAHIHLEFDYDWEAAKEEYERAIELNPRYPLAHHWYGGYLSAMGRHEEALRQAEKARELDPLSLIINTWVGLRHYFAGRYDVAIEEYGKALELGPDFAPAHWHLGWALEQAGRYEEAISEAQKAIAISGGNPLYTASLGHAYAKAGDHDQAKAVLRRLEQESTTRHVSAYHVAVIYVALGETDEAFRRLDLAYEERSPWIGYLRVDPRVDDLRADPRFDALLQRARLDV